MVTPLPHPRADSSLLERQVPPTIIETPGGMSLNLSLPLRTVREARVWEEQFLSLLQFRDREGHLRVPRQHVEDGHKLGNWVAKHRATKIMGTLFPGRERRLNAIGFIWSGQQGYFELMIGVLAQFKQREGHLRVPRQHVEDGHRLGAWICKQRLQERRGALCPEKERRLNEIGGFIWDALEARFDTMITAMVQFKQREGHFMVPQRHVEHMDGGVKLKLGTWLILQCCQQRRGKLDAKREKQLESLGVKWNDKQRELSQKRFDQNFDLLLAFEEREGHVRVPTQHQESANDHLGTWLGKQRYLHRHGLLELDRQKWLEVAGVTWESWISS
jgi:hypothetical protein